MCTSTCSGQSAIGQACRGYKEFVKEDQLSNSPEKLPKMPPGRTNSAMVVLAHGTRVIGDILQGLIDVI